MYQWKKFFPLQGEERIPLLKTQQIWLWGLSSCPISSGLFFLQWSKRPNLAWVTRNKTVMAIMGVTRSSRVSFTSHVQYMCFTEKPKQQVHKIQQLELQKSIHPGVVEGRKGRREDRWHREKKYSNQSRYGGWQMLEKSCRKTCGPFRLTSV